MKNLLTSMLILSMLVSYVAVKRAEGVERGRRGGPVVVRHTPADPQPLPKGARPLIQIALLLDTSNSMDGLIDQARTQLWDIVNEFATARRDGKAPQLQVALYEYGNSRLAQTSGFIRRVLSFTDDLDRVSEALFALQTRGGDEYCGQVIAVATRDLDWSGSSSVLKAIYIAGNEAFTQGSVDYRRSCRDASGRGIAVNTIFCGPYEQGVSGSWRDGALVARGSYANIDQSREAAAIETPYDRRIAELNSRLNTTYVPYGAAGAASAARQVAQDSNAHQKSPSSLAARATAKVSGQYRTEAWDAVAAYKAGKLNVAAAPAAELPAEMQGLDAKGRTEYLEKQSREREQVQKEIRSLADERTRYLSKHSKGKEGTLGSALSRSLREQAASKGFTFEK